MLIRVHVSAPEKDQSPGARAGVTMNFRFEPGAEGCWEHIGAAVAGAAQGLAGEGSDEALVFSTSDGSTVELS